jgi:eukaryotic-like serine/threonine-protein kinase
MSSEPIDRLDAYVNALERGDTEVRAQLLNANPALNREFECLEELHALAQAARVSGAHERATLPPLSGSEGELSESPIQPRSFGHYEILETIGRGGMGVVYKARQVDLDRPVALKMILASELASPEQVRRFETEARAAAGLRHPNIVQIFEAGRVDGQSYFAMEYVAGQGLNTVARSETIDPLRAATWMVSIARAVDYLHSRGIVHRDLKPSNILVDADGRTFVTDFGLIKMADSDLTSSHAIIGTPSYMSPEQAASQHDEVGPQSDVYSLGAILYELLTGRPPFLGASPLETLVEVLEGEPPAPHEIRSGIPREIELVCLKALAKAPEHRYQSAEDLARDLERFIAGEPVSAQPHGLWRRLVRWARQEPALVCRLGIISVCVIIVQVVYHLWHPVSALIQTSIILTLAAWAAISIALQIALRLKYRPETVQALWVTTDALMLTAPLALAQAVTTPLVLCYGALIVAAGLWFRVHLVWLGLIVSLAGYGFLLVLGASRGLLGQSPQHHLIAAASLVLVATMVATQVRRVRALSRYYDRRC